MPTTKSTDSSILPSVSALQAYGEYVEREGVLSEYWFLRDLSDGKHHKPIYGWAGGQPALVRILPGNRVVPFVPWERVESATWEELSGAHPIEGYWGMIGPSRPVARGITLSEMHLISSETARINSSGQMTPYRKNDWLLSLASNNLRNEKREVEGAPEALVEPQLRRYADLEFPLEWMEKNVHLRYVTDETGARKALVAGFPVGEEGRARLDYCEDDGPCVYTLAVTMDEPRAVAQLELFAKQYTVWHEKQVDPFRGQPSIVYFPVQHKWMSVREWGQLDMDNLAKDENEVKPDSEVYGQVFEEFIELAASSAALLA
jgi:hypothetical protein